MILYYLNAPFLISTLQMFDHLAPQIWSFRPAATGGGMLCYAVLEAGPKFNTNIKAIMWKDWAHNHDRVAQG